MYPGLSLLVRLTTISPVARVSHRKVPLGGYPFPVTAERTMPARAGFFNNDRFAYCFDLPLHLQISVKPQEPLRTNVYPGGVPTPRSGWDTEQTRYLDELVWIGMLLLNRELKYKNFYAITEALHRHYQGTQVT